MQRTLKNTFAVLGVTLLTAGMVYVGGSAIDVPSALAESVVSTDDSALVCPATGCTAASCHATSGSATHGGRTRS
ncbi:MAG: hypothetical protein JXE06_07205 [Coriobacteriia bacterium]|nr:hypothetical protein [Coriobacteriia bacterium]MBN2823454.1 hypothetical protein [Coriobacteriia bacterium]